VRRRLFIAAALDRPARSACAAAAERLRASGWAGRWLDPRTYHLTVAFLGSVEDERLADVGQTLIEAAQRLAPLTMPLDTVGAFPEPHRPRVVWVGPHAPVPAFGALCGVVRSRLVALGFTFDPDADPHVTLARADGRTPLPAVVPPSSLLHIGALTLYESFTESAGARHEPLLAVPLPVPGRAGD
jgi:RNA 2',3'-cyclic 3'-phosphodiesterase